MTDLEQIEITGAREHNLKNIDVVIPRNALTVITGLSGSGKSSLAFDTIFAEGQRRYIETFSAYARSFLGGMERPDVDKITGLSPVISIEQKTTNKNPRSTVGTTTEIYDFLRLLYARAGIAYSYMTGEKMVKYTEEDILNLISGQYAGKKVMILAPLVRARKGHYRELFEQIRKKGYLYARIDGTVTEIKAGQKVNRYQQHDIEVVVDKLKIDPAPPSPPEGGDVSAVRQANIGEKLMSNEQTLTSPSGWGGVARRLKSSLQTAMKQGNGTIMILPYPESGETSPPLGGLGGAGNAGARYFSRNLMCPTSGIAYDEPAPHHFSFNSPQGACPHCKGLGYVNRIDIDLIVPDRSQSIYSGGIAPLGKYKNSLLFSQIEAILEKYGCTLKTPLANVPAEALDSILSGTDERLNIKNLPTGASNYFMSYEGVIKYIELQQEHATSASEQKWANSFSKTMLCPECGGARLRKESLFFKIHDKNIAELAAMDISELAEWLANVDKFLSEKQQQIAVEILKEIRTRLQFLVDVGLTYLSLNRSSQSLSGGESQRIRLATQIGSQLVNVLYILDEPSIGLHQRDNQKLIHSLKQLRDLGNSIIVVEHDREMMLAADYVIDIGPRAGRFGGEIVFAGTPAEMLKQQTLTAQYLNGEKKIEIPTERRAGNGKFIDLKGARGNNLKNIDVKFPLGVMICVTGVSGSGKSTLVNETLYPVLSQHFYRSIQDPLPYSSVAGIENIDKVVNIDQQPIGRTPRSNPATYTGVFSDIRNVFVGLPEAKIRGYKPGRFSFNITGGRCEACGGNGYKTIEMNFLPDVYVPCEICGGKRYNRETLEVRFKGKSIADVLDMTVNQAVEFFENIPNILHKIKTLQDVGLGYIKLGQSSTTLSGGESQRVKLATELARRDTGKTLYMLDEPTTGLHFEDINVLLGVLNRLVNKGNTVLIIEHNLDVIKVADHIIDMGLDGGKGGGRLICAGTPEEVAKNKESYTAPFLNEE